MACAWDWVANTFCTDFAHALILPAALPD